MPPARKVFCVRNFEVGLLWIPCKRSGSSSSSVTRLVIAPVTAVATTTADGQREGYGFTAVARAPRAGRVRPDGTVEFPLPFRVPGRTFSSTAVPRTHAAATAADGHHRRPTTSPSAAPPPPLTEVQMAEVEEQLRAGEWRVRSVGHLLVLTFRLCVRPPRCARSPLMFAIGSATRWLSFRVFLPVLQCSKNTTQRS